jgi:hypothetical protein
MLASYSRVTMAAMIFIEVAGSARCVPALPRAHAVLGSSNA